MLDNGNFVLESESEVELKELNNTNWLSRKSVKSHVKRIVSSK